VNDHKEALWVVAMAGIGLLFLVILYQMGQVMAAHAETGQARISGTMWASVGTALSLCALIPYLLKDSKGLPFKVIAIVMTSIAPAVTILFIVANLLQLTQE